MTVSSGQFFRRSQVCRGSIRLPAAQFPQYTVYQSGRSAKAVGPGQVYRGVQGGTGRHRVHVAQLVGSQSQEAADLGLQMVEAAMVAAGQVGIQASLHAGGSQHQFGSEPPLPL